MTKVETDVRRALEEFPIALECGKGGIFDAAIAHMTVACSAAIKGQSEPLSGVLGYNAGPPETLSGYLTQWQYYGPGSSSLDTT